MKVYKHIKSIVLAASILLSGCSKGLDEGLDIQPTGAVSQDVYWSTERDAQLAVNAIYNELDGTQSVIALDGVTDIAFHSASNLQRCQVRGD
ncbi:hypothetical protein LCGC14_1336670 [marine sediment metagenome]|uniref:Uncharacterized protein n=1 Tax=marine sediment metagenome TaxID=412755 RepID=A0A0F9L158_9ZZZZ